MVGSVVGCGLWVGVVVGQWWLWIGVGCGLWWLFLHLCSLLSTDPTPSPLSLPSLVAVFGCARSLKGVVGRGWIRCGLWVVGCGSALLWVSGGCGLAWLWVVGRRGCGLWVVDRCGCGLWDVDRRSWVVVVDRRAGMKRVVGRGSAVEGGRWSWIGG